MFAADLFTGSRENVADTPEPQVTHLEQEEKEILLTSLIS